MSVLEGDTTTNIAAGESHDPANPVQADLRTESEEEKDEGLGEDASQYTASINSSYYEAVRENGRGYHKYKDGIYVLPEDEQEQERLDLQHVMMREAMGGKLLSCPFEQEEIRHVLDLGTGTGCWAFDFADENPDAQVVGTDLSPIQPPFVPANCKFEIDDWESEWTFQQKFDIIHGRMMMSSMDNPQRIFEQAYDALAPGGWFEMQDLYMPIGTDDNSLPEDGQFRRWMDLFESALMKIGRNVSWAKDYATWMQQQGFVNVNAEIYKIPIGTWAKDPHFKKIGHMNLINMTSGIEGFCLRLFDRVLGMDNLETQVLLAHVRKELPNRKVHAYWPIYVVYGQKPI